MKWISMVSILSLTLICQAEDKSSGCGLGWKVTSRNSLLSSYTRSITNSLTSSTSGMTSGTSGCEAHSLVKNEKKDLHFAEANFHSLMVEMAKGQGEYLTGFAMVMGCSENAAQNFFKMTQKNYEHFFPAQGTSPFQLVEQVRGVMTTQGVCNSSAS